MNRPARFTLADVRRALKAAKAHGQTYAVEIAPDGTIRIVPQPDGPRGGLPAVEPKDEFVF